MRAIVLVLLAAACTNGDEVVDQACQGTTTDAACRLCCRDQGFTDEASLQGDECVCRRQDVGDGPRDIDLDGLP